MASSTIPTHVDIAIVGAGPVGAALALALKDLGLDALVLEARALSSYEDPRTLALSYGSRLILERLGVWDLLNDITPIQTVHVSQKGGFGRTTLSAVERALPALGYVTNYGNLQNALHTALNNLTDHILCNAKVTAMRATSQYSTIEFEHFNNLHTLTTRLLVLAEGGSTLNNINTAHKIDVRVREYNQCGLVALVKSERSHQHTAYERFTPEGPIALLPYGDRSALIWTTSFEKAEELRHVDADLFLKKLHQHFGDRLGNFIEVGQRAIFPLSLTYTKFYSIPRTILLGNAAQTLHPVTGQGLNLGLRDAWELADEIRQQNKEDVGSAALIHSYLQRRRMDRAGGIWFTDSLVRLFSNDFLGFGVARGIGLAAFDCFPTVKHFLSNRMIFGAVR